LLRGHGHLLARSAVAMVGARNASLNGRRLAQNLAAELGRSGLSVVSGLAAGIDTAAHRGALETGTVAVLAGGPDHVYPSENADLHARIAEIGALVSERPPGFRPQARDFPRRNRIISGLSLGVAVIEPALKSGSLITARLSGEQRREVMAVPGAPADPRARGCNNLIRQGAALVETADDVLQALAPLTPEQFAEPVREEIDPAAGRLTRPARPERLDTESARATLLESLSTAPVQLDELIRNCQLSPQLVLVALLELELAGRVNRHPGGRVSRNFDGDQDALALG